MPMLFNQEKHSKFPQLEENNNNKEEEEEEEEKEGGLIDLTNKSIILITKYDFISDDKDQLNIKAKQFLKLLVPRIVGIEASYKVLSTENPIMESQQKPRPIKRKKQS